MSETRWHALHGDAVIAALETDPKNGLGAEQASDRLAEYGYNELTHEEGTSALKIFVNQFRNVLILILLAAVVLAALVGEAVDALIILIIVVFCAVLGFVQEFRAERALEALEQMLSQVVSVLRDGRRVEIPSRELVPGDILFLEAGDRVAADVRLLESHSLRCDEASLTGESAPVGKHPDRVAAATPLAERTNMAFAGTTVTYGRGKTAVTGTGMRSEFGKIAGEVATIETGKTPLEKRTDEIGKWLAIICLSICALVVVISLVRGHLNGNLDFEFAVTMIMFAIALAVAAVPEALAAIVTGALALGMHALAKRNAIVRKMPVVETLGCTTVICSDKTGTLTTGEMTVRRVYGFGGPIEVSGAGYAPAGELRRADGSSPVTDPAFRRLLEAGLLCNDSELFEQDGKWHIKGDPTEAALLVLAAKAGLQHADTRNANPRIEEFPFSSERKRMSTLHSMADGASLAFMKGAPEVVLERCSSIADGADTR
ncbi:MAG: HAD-IC family P-type ATPase, partial [Gammaproteobacteria bacterium]|nr:HAD-IC family P-type ATPase [Gammaproteobacteria bacterium]